MRTLKYEQLLHIEDHDFAMRPGFEGDPLPGGIDVQLESTASISEVNMLSFSRRYYWKDEKLSFPSMTNKSMTFDHRLIKKIWVPDTFCVHSKRSFIHDMTVENSMLCIHPDGNALFSLRRGGLMTVSAMCFMDSSRVPLDRQNCSLELESYAYNEEDLMLYRRRGNRCLNTDKHISLSRSSLEFIASSGLAFYSSTGITTELTVSTSVPGVSASRPRCPTSGPCTHPGVSSLFVSRSVIEFAVRSYLTAGEGREQLSKAGKVLPG
ncbi:PREDICTED: gamma-aminobutyric acid receptor subunit rho-3 [Myotis davidii]|uniref:gamma-aminobutyric acid receptor subunit rho-3 n=1 Tax=Myotis davidii TaxID=225400 RepID=UPI0003EC2730|nr:PREDICTED: gamma-aminobutyric acid receptor subunit rho-3 [Myotis davidii]